MFGIADFIVGLWFLPVVLYVVLPLAMLCGRMIFRLIAPQKSRRDVAEGQDVSLKEIFSISEARA